MTLGLAIIVILLVAVAIGGISYVRATRLRADGRLHSLPAYHAAHAVLWILAPALLVLAAWAPMQTRLVDQAVLATPEGQALPDFEMQRDTILAEARQIANREIEAGFNPESTALRHEGRREGRYSQSAALGTCCAWAAASFSPARAAGSERGRPSKRWMNGCRCSVDIAILTTPESSVAMLESLRFCHMSRRRVHLCLTWSPQTAIARSAGSSEPRSNSFLGNDLIGASSPDRRHPAGLMSAITSRISAPKCGRWQDSARNPAAFRPSLRYFAGRPSPWFAKPGLRSRRIREQRKRARRGPRHGYHDHPVRQFHG